MDNVSKAIQFSDQSIYIYNSRTQLKINQFAKDADLLS